MKKEQNHFSITREKHLDHMTKVVPFIVMCYAIQSFVIMKVAPGDFSSVSLSVLGCFLAAMIGGFITYDLKHSVTLEEDHFVISFFHVNHKISYHDIESVHINEPAQSFSNVSVKTPSGKFTFFFIDEGDKVKAWLEEKRQKTEYQQAA